ncbi:MAG: lipid-binding SYLF domain-containing protein [Betaproteobacteria bacterium]
MTWFHRHFGQPKAVLIARTIAKAGYIFGRSGGRAIFFARDYTSGRWVGPAFFGLGAASVGFQSWVDVSESVMPAMTEGALDSLLSNFIKLGGDARTATDPVSAGAKSDLTADFVAFSHSTGIHGGLNLEGSIICASDHWNPKYCGMSVLPPTFPCARTSTMCTPTAGRPNSTARRRGR